MPHSLPHLPSQVPGGVAGGECLVYWKVSCVVTVLSCPTAAGAGREDDRGGKTHLGDTLGHRQGTQPFGDLAIISMAPNSRRIGLIRSVNPYF